MKFDLAKVVHHFAPKIGRERENMAITTSSPTPNTATNVVSKMMRAFLKGMEFRFLNDD